MGFFKRADERIEELGRWAQNKKKVEMPDREEIRVRTQRSLEKSNERSFSSDKLIRIIALAIFLLGCFFIYTYSTVQDKLSYEEGLHGLQVEERQNSIDTLVEEKENQATPDPVDVSKIIDEATRVAEEIARLQNQFPDIEVTTDINGTTGVDEINAIRKQLSKFFTPGSRGASFDPAEQWLSLAGKTSQDYQWHDAIALDSFDGDKVAMSWYARDTKTNVIYAWVHGVYDEQQHGFTDLKIGVTAQGQDAIGGTYSGDSVYNEGNGPLYDIQEGESHDQTQ